MAEQNINLLERKLRVLRDWLIPSTLVIGICISIILYIFSLNPLTKLLKASAIASIVGVFLLVYNLLHIFGVIGLVEEEQKDPPDWQFFISYIVSLGGIIAFLASLSLLCFVKSALLGVISVILIVLMIVFFIWWVIKSTS